MSKVLSINGLKQIYDNYDTFIIDQWGVMHDGLKGYAKAIKCVDQLFLENKNLIIISNSSRRKIDTIKRLPILGFNPNYFKEVMTSGEMIWQSLYKDSYDEINNLGKNCFYIFDHSKMDGESFIKGLSKIKIVEKIEEANFILACTPFANKEVNEYIPILEKALKKGIPFLCANPDYETVESSEDKNIFCMGTIGELYSNMGGIVFLLGKPNIDIYNESTKNIDSFKKSRTLAIGDSLHHDIKGAIEYGIDSLLIVSTGIHKNLFNKKEIIWDMNNKSLLNIDIKPTFICSEFFF